MDYKAYALQMIATIPSAVPLPPAQRKAAEDVAARWYAWLEDPEHNAPPNPKEDPNAPAVRAYREQKAREREARERNGLETLDTGHITAVGTKGLETTGQRGYAPMPQAPTLQVPD